MNDLVLRGLTGIGFVGVMVLSIWLADAFVFIVMGAIGAFGLYEFYTLKKNPLHGPTRWLSIALGISFYGAFTAMYFNHIDPFFIPHFLLVPLLSVFIVEIYRNKQFPLENTSLSFFGWLYILAPLFLLSVLSNHDFLYALAPLIMIWSNDSFAYLGGRFFGKRSLFERISPKKTWEGTICGVLAAAVAGAIIAQFTDSSFTFWIFCAIPVAVASVLGDLFESLFKRSLNVKDSGKLLPGHGGILDRFDATFFAIPIFYLVLTTAAHWRWIDLIW